MFAIPLRAALAALLALGAPAALAATAYVPNEGAATISRTTWLEMTL